MFYSRRNLIHSVSLYTNNIQYKNRFLLTWIRKLRSMWWARGLIKIRYKYDSRQYYFGKAIFPM
jgi:hypothetical protein